MIEKNIQKLTFIKRPIFSFCVSSVFILLLIAAGAWMSGFSFRHMALAGGSIAQESAPPNEIQQAFSKTCYLDDPTPECLNSIEPVAGDQ